MKTVHALNYAPYSGRSRYWAYACIFTGTAGAPLSVALGFMTATTLPTLICSAGAIAIAYAAQRSVRRIESAMVRRLGWFGIILILLWAPPLFIWMCIFSLVRV